jgi:hypothetical protein
MKRRICRTGCGIGSQDLEARARGHTFGSTANRLRKVETKLSHIAPSCFRVVFTTSPVVVSSIANVCWRAYKSHFMIFTSAPVGPSPVWVNTEQSTRVVTRPATVRHQSGIDLWLVIRLASQCRSLAKKFVMSATHSLRSSLVAFSLPPWAFPRVSANRHGALAG